MKHPRQRYAIFRFYASFCLLFLSKRSGSDVDELAASCPDGQVLPPDVCLVYLDVKDALPDAYADGKACFQFPISKDAADSVNVKVMTSEDLVNWVEAPSSNIGKSGDFNLMQTEQPIPEGGKLFFKLIVEEK